MRATIQCGDLEGFIQAETAAFLGIPYAQPPVGRLRFQPPVEPASWVGARDATYYRSAPVQRSPFMNGGTTFGSEDCLYLNLWSSLSAKSNKPTIVWVYGGGFEGGTASSDEFNGAEIATMADAVFINFNYRVGFLGFGALPESEDYPVTTNLGFRDLLAVLRWVQNNVQAFGGDPRNVTVFGQSAGAFIASALLSSQDYSSLFQRVFLMSGGTSRYIPLEQTRRITNAAMASYEPGQVSVESVSVDDLLTAQRSLVPSDMGERNGLVPKALGMTLDSETAMPAVPVHPMEAVVAGQVKSKEILVSCDESEVHPFRRFLPATFACEDQSELVLKLQRWGITKQKTESLVELYALKAPDASPPELMEQILTDYIYRLPAARLLQAHSAAGGECWGIEFVGAENEPMGHGDELPALFDGTAKLKNVVPNPNLRASLMSALVNFAKFGNPGWPAYDSSVAAVQLMGRSADLRKNLYAQLLGAWHGVERP